MKYDITGKSKTLRKNSDVIRTKSLIKGATDYCNLCMLPIRALKSLNHFNLKFFESSFQFCLKFLEYGPSC